MAVNPQLFPNGMPVPFVNELFVLARDGVEFHVDKISGFVPNSWIWFEALDIVFYSLYLTTSILAPHEFDFIFLETRTAVFRFL